MFPIDIFDEKKASQAAAFFLFRSGGEMEMSILKLMKLLYLAERRSYQMFGEPMIGDRLVSMPHGPVLSRTYNFMNGELPSHEKGWAYWIGGVCDNKLSLQGDRRLVSPEADLLELSDADLGVLENTWQEFGHMTASQIRNYTHTHCPEWRDPNGSMIPMTYGELFAALEFSQEKAQDCIAHLEEKNSVAASFRVNCA